MRLHADLSFSLPNLRRERMNVYNMQGGSQGGGGGGGGAEGARAPPLICLANHKYSCMASTAAVFNGILADFN